MSATSQEGRRTTANYDAKVTFAKGDANIKLLLIKHDDHWQIAGFRVNSAALLPQ